jgi:hypothetical protein
MSCHALESAASGESPFSRDFFFDWYDGPVSGLVECGPGGGVFTFRMVAWDDRQTRRIYVLQPTSAKLFDGKPLAHEEEGAWARYEEILRSAGPIEYVVQAEDRIPGPLRSVHRVGEGALRERIASMISTAGSSEDFAVSDHPFDEWVALLRTIS